MLPRLLGRTTRATRPGVAEAVRQMAGGWSVAGMVGAQRAMRARPDSTETLRGLRLPALVIGGGGDEIAPPPVVGAIGALIRSEEDTSEIQFQSNLVCRLLV